MANSKNITFDQLQAALSRVKSALDGKANTSHGNHVPKTETANNARFLRNDNTWQTITPVNIGAADRSHSHGSYVNQNAFTNIKVGDTTVAADSPTDTLTLTAGANVTLTPDATNDTVTIAAKDTVYTHPTTSGYKHIPSGGSSGQILRWSADGTAAWGSDNNTDTKVTNTLNTTAKAYVTGTTSATTNTGTQVFDTGVYLDTTAGKLVATTFAGALSGNASSATQLQTARKFTIGNTERTFNGSGDVKWTLADIGAAASSHTHNYVPLSNNSNTIIKADADASSAEEYAQLQAGHNYLRVTSSAGGSTTTQGADKLTFNGNIVYHAGRKPTPAEIGAAAASHGTHVTWSTTTPKANGTAAVGTETKVARGDHVHPLQTTVSGNAGTATKLATARGLKIGNTSKNFDGSANVEWSLSEIGAAASGHTHNKITSRGKVAAETGTTRPAVDGLSMTEVYNNEYPTAYGNAITLKGQGDGQILVGWSGSSGGHAPVYVRSKRDTTDANWSGWAQFYTSANPQPSVTGNAGTATKLANARTLTIGNTGKTFDGSGNVSWSLSEIGAAATSHGTHVTYATATPLVAGTAAVGTSGKVAREDHVHPAQTAITGNAGTATKLQTARKLTIGNTGKNFDGSGNVSWTLGEIGAASSGHSHTNINFLDKRSENTTPANVSNGISLHLKSAGTAGLNDGGSYYASLFLKPWNDISGGPYANIAVTGNHNIWLRTATANDSWNSWRQIAFTSSSITGNAASATKLQNARNIKIGNTTRSFNGTADVTWTLSDIGAAASNHGHSNMLTFKANHAGDWTSATSMADKVYMGGWHGTITDSSKNKGYVSLGLATSGKALDFMLDGDFYANENNLVLNTGNYKSHVTPANIGAANASHGTHVTYGGNGSATTVSRSDHTHSYIPLGGSSSITGNLEFSNSGTTARGVIGTMGDNDFWRIVGGATASNSGYLEIATADDGNEPIYVRQYSSGKFVTLGRTATLLDGSGNTSFPGTVTAPTFKGALNGNASTATKLQTARKINDIAFDGSADKTIPLKTFGSYVGSDNTKNYHRILSSGNVTGQFTDKSITLMASSDYADGAYGIVRIQLRTNNSTTVSSGRIEWIVRKGFNLDSIVFNIKNTAGATIMDVFYKSPGAYANVTWTVLGEGVRDGRNGGNGGYGATWTKYNTAAGSTETYTADTMKTVASYTSTLNQGTDVTNVNSANKLSTARSINGTNFDGTRNITTANWGTARNLTIGNTAKSVNGSGNVSWSLSEIGALPIAGGTMTGVIKVDSGVASENASAPTQLAYGLLSSYGDLKLLANTDNSEGANNEYVHIAAARGLAPAINQGIVVYGTYANAFGSKIVTEGSGNAPTATKLKTARSIGITGAVSGSANFDGSGNISINTSLKYPTSGAYWNNGAMVVSADGVAETGKYIDFHNTNGSTNDYDLRLQINSANKNVVTLPSSGGTLALTSDNVASATKLQTARTINGTSFNGTANITTANWGTARTLTIGNSGKSVNGSGNVSWSLSEIGAAPIANASQMWSASVKCATWSRLFYFSGNGTTGGSFMFNIQGTRGNVVHNVTLLVNFSHSNQCNIVQLHNTSYSNMQVRCITKDHQGYVEVYDNANNATNSTTQALNVTFTPLSNVSITKYTAFTNGSTVPSGYATKALTTVSGSYYSGNAATATKLQTSRTLTVGKTGKNFDGSGNVSWSTSEILHQGKITNQDWNTANVEGVYQIENFSGSNSPNGAYKWGGLLTLRSGSVTNQVYLSHSNNEMWIRGGWDGTWNGSWSRVYTTSYKPSPSDIGAAASSHGNHVPATQSADNKKFLRNDNTWQVVSPANIGAAPVSAGGNITIHADSDASSTSEYALIKAGHNELKVASSAGGGTVTRGQDKLTFNGNIVYHAGRKPTLSELGAAASNHSHNNYAASSHEHNYLNVKGTNTINSTANDTTAKWGAQKSSVHWYTEAGKINGQPSQWGYLVNIGQDSEVHQVWMTQSSGDLLHRGGNGSGWAGSWRTILDSSNYSTWAAAKSHSHNYAGSSSAGGNANAAVKLATARTLTIGNKGKNFDGSGNVSWSLSEIGAAAANHNHNYAASNHNHDSAYLKLSGGTLTGRLTANGYISVPTKAGPWISGMTLNNASIGISTQQTASSYHPILAVKTAGGHVANIGGINNDFGFYGFKSGRTENATDWSFKIDASSGHINHTHNITASTMTAKGGFCVSKNSKEAWLDIGDNDTYLWASGANKSIQITHGGDLNFDGQPVLYGGRGNNYDTATNTIYFNNAGASHKGRISCYKDGSNKDYVQTALRTASDTTNYVNIYEDTVKVGSNNIYLGGKKLTIATSAPSGPATGDVWINIG